MQQMREASRRQNALAVTALAFWTQRNLDFWLTHFRGHAVHVPFFLDFVLCIFAPFMLVGNIVAEIARYTL
jgi:hypothetical protein